MARKTGSINHIHRYMRRPDGLWACAGVDDCTHFMPKNMYPSPVGKMTICWSCGKVFRLTWIHMEDKDTDKPFCDACNEQVALEEAHDKAQEKVEVISDEHESVLPSMKGKHMSYCNKMKGGSVCTCGVEIE